MGAPRSGCRKKEIARLSEGGNKDKSDNEQDITVRKD